MASRRPGRYLKTFLEPTASFCQSMSPCRATATPFMPEITKYYGTLMSQITDFPKLFLIFLFFGGYFEWVRPIPKDAYRLPPSPKEGVWGVYLSSEIDFIRILWVSGGAGFLSIMCCLQRQDMCCLQRPDMCCLERPDMCCLQIPDMCCLERPDMCCVRMQDLS